MARDCPLLGPDVLLVPAGSGDVIGDKAVPALERGARLRSPHIDGFDVAIDDLLGPPVG